MSSRTVRRTSVSRRVLAGMMISALAASAAQAATIVKQNNADALNLGSSWVGGQVPGAIDFAQWDATVAGANSVSLGADANWRGIILGNPGGAVTIGGANVLTLGQGGIDMTAATQDLAVTSSLTLGQGAQAWNVATGRTLSISGPLSRAAGSVVTVSGGQGTIATTAANNASGIVGAWAFVDTAGTAANNTAAGLNYATVSGGNLVAYTGATAVVGTALWPSNATSSAFINYDSSWTGTASLGVNRYANTVRFTSTGGIIDQNGPAQLITNGLLNAGSGVMQIRVFLANATLNNSELVINSGTAGFILTKGINTANGSLVVAGSSVVNFTGANNAASAYTGATTVVGGTLQISGVATINATSGITVNGDTAKYLHTSSAASTRTITLTRGAVDGVGTIGTVNVANLAGATVANGNGATGTLNIGNLNFAGAATVNARVIAGATPINVTGALTTNPGDGLITLNLAAPGGWNTGLNNIIGFGAFAGAASNFALGTVANLNPRQSAGSIVLNGSNVAFTVAGDSPRWSGALSGEWSAATLAAPKNWKLITSGAITDYIDVTDDVLFDDLATGTTNVDISVANVTPRSLTVNNTALNYTFGGTAAVTGTTGLVKNGTGKLTINNANTYTGATSVNAGTVQLNGTLTGSPVTVAAGSTLTQGASGVITGATAFSTSGFTTLAGFNTYTGATQILGGNTTVSGAFGNTAINLAGGTLNLQSANAISQNVLTLNGGVLTQSVDNAIAGTAGVNVRVNAALSAPNSYAGDTTINSGTGVTLTVTNELAAGSSRFNMATGAINPVLNLHIDGAGSDGTIAMANAFGGNSGVATTIDVNNNGGGNVNNQIQLNGFGAWGNGTINVTGGNGYSLKIAFLNNSAGSAGTMVLNPTTAVLSVDTVSSTTAFAKTLTLDGTNAGNTVTGSINNSAGTLALLKSNASTWTLTNASSYTGATTVSGGKLILGASNALPGTTAVSVTGGTLDASGFGQSVASLTVNSGGTLSLGIGNVFGVSGAAAFNGTLNIVGTPSGTTQLMTYGSFSGAFASVLNLPSGYILQYKANELALVAPTTIFFNGAAGNGTWDDGTTVNFTDGANSLVYSNALPYIVTFDDATAGGGHNQGQFNIAVNGSVSPISARFTANAANYTLGGGSLAGDASLVKSGTGTLTLTGSNNYAGGTTLAGGKLNVANASALSTGPITITGGTLDNTSGADMVNAANNVLAINGDLVFVGTNSLDLGTGAATVGGAGDRTLTVAANVLTIGELRSATQNVTKAGNGTLVLTSTGPNGGANGTIVGGTLTVASGTLQYNRAGVTGGDAVSGDLTVGALAGAGTIVNGAGEARWVYVNGTASASTFAGVLADGGAGKLALIVNGGTTTLAGVNTYTDNTTVNAGVLNFAGGGSIAASTAYILNGSGVLQVDSSARLGAAPITINSSGATPGNNTNSLEISGNALISSPITLAPRNPALNSPDATDAIVNVSGNNTLSGPITIITGGSQARVRSDAGAMTLAGPITTTAGSVRNLYLTGAGNGNVSGIIADNTANAAGTVSIVKDGTGTWALSAANTTTGSITVNAGKLAMQTVSNAHSGATINGGTLALGGAGQAFAKPVTIGGTTNAWTGQLDVGADSLVVQNNSTAAKATAVATLVNQMIAGKNGGTWNGNGITSSAIPGNVNATLAIADNATLGLATLGGQPLDANSVIVTRALLGDADLSGNVDLGDFDRWFANVSSNTYNYAQGDFDLSGIVDLGDFDIWFSHVGVNSFGVGSAAGLSITGGASAVPEPASLAVLALGGAALLGRRRRK